MSPTLATVVGIGSSDIGNPVIDSPRVTLAPSNPGLDTRRNYRFGASNPALRPRVPAGC